MKRKYNIRQHDVSDCGVACIASIALYYGKSIALTVIREASGTCSAGTSIKGLIDSCQKLGLVAKAWKSENKELATLEKMDAPLILHIINQSGDLHFVVLYGFRKRKAIVMDPATGETSKWNQKSLSEMWTGYLVTLRPGPGFESLQQSPSTTKLSQLYRLLPWRDMSALVCCALAYTCSGICIALFLEHIIDNVLPTGEIHQLGFTLSYMILLMVMSVAVGYRRIIYSLRVSTKMDSILTLTYLRKLLSLPVAFFSHRSTGELHSRLNDIPKIRLFLTEGILDIFCSTLLLCGAFLLMFSCHWQLALLMLAFIPVYLLLYIVADKVNRRINREIIESSAAFEEKAVEGIASVGMIKHFGKEGNLALMIEKRYTELIKKIYRGGRKLGFFSSSTDATTRTMTVCLLGAGSVFIFGDSLSVGKLVSFYALSATFSASLGQLVNISNSLSEARIASERFGDIVNLESENNQGTRPPEGKAACLCFEDVSFAYAGGTDILQHLSLCFEKGKISAVCGPSGCGKSTLASLIMRDCQPCSGKISLDGSDISQFSLSSWREYVSIVPQQNELLNGSLLDNICCYDSEPDVEKIAGLIEKLGLHDFVASLPLGLLTPVGERGCSLSGGQRQRVALARALYRNSKILILDEATSSLDDESQSYVLRCISELRNHGHIIIMISHKSDNIALADTVIRL